MQNLLTYLLNARLFPSLGLLFRGSIIHRATTTSQSCTDHVPDLPNPRVKNNHFEVKRNSNLQRTFRIFNTDHHAHSHHALTVNCWSLAIVMWLMTCGWVQYINVYKDGSWHSLQSFATVLQSCPSVLRCLAVFLLVYCYLPVVCGRVSSNAARFGFEACKCFIFFHFKLIEIEKYKMAATDRLKWIDAYIFFTKHLRNMNKICFCSFSYIRHPMPSSVLR